MSAAVKICGIRTLDALDTAVDAGCAYVGFVCYPPSPRHVDIADAASLARALPAQVKSVVVTVNPADALVARIRDTLGPDTLIQLHGQETPQRMLALREHFPGLKLIKAIPIAGQADLDVIGPYLMAADMLLFDAKPPAGALPGGNGIRFDWTLLKNAYFTDLHAQVPWFLSGGLAPENVAQAIAQSGARMVDVSSGVESAPGVKDNARIRAFLRAVQESQAA